MPDWVTLCAVIGLPLACYLLYSGLLSDITIFSGSPPIKKITFAYKFKEGPYRHRGQLFRESSGIGPKLPCIGIYYDKPDKVPGPERRYAVGSILSEGEDKANEELLKRYETSGFKVFSFPEATHVVTTSFPYRTFGSIFLALYRVYPRLTEYMKKRKLWAYPIVEIYRDGQIQFMAPLARQGDFYVPEAHEKVKKRPEEEESYSDTDVSGAESNSEYSSGSGVLLSDSRETSLAASSVHSTSIHDQGDREYRERSFGGTSLIELDWEQTDERQDERQEQLHGDSNQKSAEAPPQELLGVVGGEE
ncbi:testis-expressed protein 264 [Scomber japonicus]|uniref:testis-expressed protein 264 n=1 Tax=Scomber japonicus TaxID=13676 RepID=UPI002305E6AE|nr:testis-expressed protein 264 [Scomber japonicus]